MNYRIFAMIFTVIMIITTITIITKNTFGQTSNVTLQEGQTTNKKDQLQSEQQDQVLDKEIIEVSTEEFDQLLDEIKGSINLIQDKKYDAASSKLGLAIIEILNSTQQYQELVQFASSQYIEKIQQQQFNDEKEK